MTIYIDDGYERRVGEFWYHLISDDVEDLHDFARDVGLKDEWFYYELPHISNFPHYKIPEDKRSLVIANGAVALERKDFLEKASAILHQ